MTNGRVLLDERMRGRIKDIVIARLETLNPDSKVLLMGENRSLSVKDLLAEVNQDSELGKRVVEVQYAYLKMLTTGEL